jgi:hypothetical protein
MNAPAKIKPEEAKPVHTFSEALVRLQAAIRPAIKDANNPAFRAKYADLGAVWEAVKDPLKENGFAVVQMPQFEGDTMYLETMLIHESGDKLTGRYPLRPSKPDPQGYGSAITYARRYAISAMLGVIADDDDDGNAASNVGQRTVQTAPAKPATPHNAEQDQDVTDGVTNWVEAQKRFLNACGALPSVYTWLEKIAGAGTITDPDTSSPLDRLKKKSPEAYGEIVQAFQLRLRQINSKESK